MLQKQLRIMILEDMQYRIDLFKGHIPAFCTVQFFETAWPAIDYVCEFKCDLIFLDHDLGGKQFVIDDTINGTGYDVATIIPETINKDTPIVVHSVNPVGAQRMVNALANNAVHIPFSGDFFNIVKFH